MNLQNGNDRNSQLIQIGDKENSKAVIKSIIYLRPKIFLIDLETEIANAIREKGYNVSEGSLGTPYLVDKNNGLFPVLLNHKLVYDYKEQDIIIIDLHCKNPIEKGKLDLTKFEDGGSKWWIDHQYGQVNPRKLIGNYVQNDFNRILNTGGIFIIFADKRDEDKFFLGRGNGYNWHKEKEEIDSNWSFLGLMDDSNYFKVNDDHGSMINFTDKLQKGSLLMQFLPKYIEKTKYDCTIFPGHLIKDNWISLMENKFSGPVGSVITPNKFREGYVFIFPDIGDKASFLSELIDQVLPEIVPRLYPEREKFNWIIRPEYELPAIKTLNQQIIEIREKTDKEITELEQLIRKEKEKNAYLFHLITESGNVLVESVIETFKILGFTKIIDVDEDLAKKGIEGKNREDLQIHDYDTTLIVEIKGINNFPSDNDALTVQKYVILRMREWSRTNVKGISIINFQRHLPPLERNNDMPFRQEILDTADEQLIGLMTTWDLHRIARSYIQLNWKHEYIRDIFYQNGRIQATPTHYQYIGKVDRYIEKIKVIGIQIENGSLRLGDKIAFELPIIFEEQICESLQFDNTEIDEAQTGMLIGTKTNLKKEQARIGTRVYRINPGI